MTLPDKFRKKEWFVETIPMRHAQLLVELFHYARSGSNTAVYRHGLFRVGDPVCRGVAWWLPPTKSAAMATYPPDWRAVLALHRLVVCPEVPKNGASFLIGASRKMVDRTRWPCLVTYADTMQGHEGRIYRATNWAYCGTTGKDPAFAKNGVLVSRKAGGHTRTYAEMKDLGCEKLGSFAKHKFVDIK